mmetsp:Transcript_7382/g.17986  ORF Transcript_7382/g.17986 Transcript_7382/m.17986 type:complete len:252 (-) Transcript_7382:308-1063(-)|eukprot:CAMPEP_0114493102 /NCGR_PEP_ID=MMETSP0109-20121206/3926_1 /TAXON_ID=29199 /ORGANISM="Chlorarachnion reptans, Strain CCCM449" /LENGTH=251 /DNA_ID=CAMNT_0001670023 /DNA_START=42 /DNA_END=797 /DNA_ORIENTATION=+
MIQAQKAQLEKKIRLDALAIQQVELQFFISNFQAVASQAAFLAGFSLSGMFVDLETSDGENNTAIRTVYYLTTSFALGFLLLCVTNSTLCCVFGPEKALLGKEGSMSEAIQALKNERRTAFSFFGVGMLCFHISAILYSVIQYETTESVLVVLALTAFIFAFIIHGRRIYNVLKIEGEQETGEMKIGDYDIGAGKYKAESKEELEKKIVQLQDMLNKKNQLSPETAPGSGGARTGSDEPDVQRKGSWFSMK